MWLTEACHLRPDGTFGVADIAVEGGTITEIAAPGSRPGLDCSGRVVLPGLVNAHYHSQATVMRGLDTGLDLFDWFGDSPAGRIQTTMAEFLDDPANEAAVAAITRYEYLTLLRQGVTLVADSGVSEVSPEVLAAAGDEVGLRSLPQTYDDWIERVADPSRFTVHIESEEDLTAEVVETSVRYRDRYRPVFALHCLETVKRRELALERWERSSVSVLADNGLLGPRTVLFHGCEMDAEDIDAVARAGSSVIFCPVSNLTIHGRLAPASQWFRAGVRIGLGTDWGDTDLWSTLRTAWLLMQRTPDPADRPSRTDVLRMATRDGALGYARDDLGEIAPGRTADLVLLDADRLRPAVRRPDVSTLDNAVLAAGAGAVRDVMVGGEWVLRDELPVRVDPDGLLRDYRRVLDQLPR